MPLTESTFAFGPEANLPGTLTVPDGGPGRRVAVLLLDSGVIHRVGPHRINVKLARRLAADGFVAFRFDLSPVGDGVPARGAASFDRQAVAEIALAMDEVERRTGIGRFVVYGICSGAVHAFAAARDDARIAGIYMQDGYAFPTRRARLRRWTLPLATDPMRVLRAFARRIVTLPGRVRDAAPVAAADPGPIDAPLGPGGRTPAQFAALLDALAARGTSSRLLYTGTVLELYNYPSQFAESIPVRAAPTMVGCDFAPDIDHTLSNLHAQRSLVGRILAWARAEDERAATPPTGGR